MADKEKLGVTPLMRRFLGRGLVLKFSYILILSLIIFSVVVVYAIYSSSHLVTSPVDDVSGGESTDFKDEWLEQNIMPPHLIQNNTFLDLGDGWVNYSNPLLGVSFIIPDTWGEIKRDGIVVFLGRAGSGDNVNLIVETTFGKTRDEYHLNSIENVKLIFPNLVIFEDGESDLYGEDSRHIIFKGFVSGGNIKSDSISTYRGNYTVIFTATHFVTFENDTTEIIDKVIDSYRITPGKFKGLE